MPSESRLSLSDTYENQRQLVNKLVPAVMNALDQESFPVSEGIVREIIHNRHKHQREGYLSRRKPETFQKEQEKRKHQNSRRNDVTTN